MQNSNIVIEEPLPTDAAEIFFVQRQTWHESYLGLKHEPFQGSTEISHETIEKRFTNSLERIERIKSIIRGDQDGKYFIARDKDANKILGFISLLTKPQNEINSLYMLDSSKGLGLGRKLMEKALDWYGNKEIVVHTHSDNIQAFYKKFGFEFAGKYPDIEGFSNENRTLCRKAE